MRAADVPAVAALEASSFSTPWHPDTFQRLLERPGAELWVTEEEGEVAAYAVLWCILDEGELANIAVLPEARGRGVGGRLLDHLVEVARDRGVRRLFLEVRESNEAARRLYATRGFREVGRRRAYYEKPREDARVLALDLVPDSPR
jgi:ribosomal-protein-alanine N-acetyltransferase